MDSYKFISADSHIVEPEDLWVTRMDRRFRDRAPRAEMRNGEKFMVVEASLEVSLDADVLKATDDKHRPALDQSSGGRHEKTRPGGLDPHLRLLDQDADNIAAEIVYPNWGLYFFATPDPEYQREAMRVYNEFIAEYCQAESGRLTPVGLLPLKGPIEWAIEEAERCARSGMPQVMIAAGIPRRPYHDPHYQPLWDALENLNLMVAMHAGCYDEPFVDFSYQSVLPQSLIVEGKIVLLERGMVNLISGAVPQQYPRLRFVLVEGGIGWIAPVLRLMDHFWEDHHQWMQPRLAEPPSFYFKRQFWATFEDDRPGLMTRSLINPDHLMWGSDYPHSEGTFPYSRQKIVADFADIPADETRRLVRDNASNLYRLNV